MTETPTTVVLFPGGSLMDIRMLTVDTALIRCPGCGATMVFTARSVGATSQITFLHEDDECPVLKRIEAVLAAVRAAEAN